MKMNTFDIWNDSNATEPQPNASCSVQWSDSYTIAMTVTNVLLGMAGIFGNAFVVVLVAVVRRLRYDPPNILLANVALIELLYFLFSHPITTWNVIVGGALESNNSICYLQGFLNTMLVPLCWVAHALMSLEKYCALGTTSRGIFSTRKSMIFVVCSWIVCTGFAAFPLVGFDPYQVTITRLVCLSALHKFTDPIFIYLNIALIAGFLVTAWSYGCLYRVVRKLRERQAKRNTGQTKGAMQMAPVGKEADVGDRQPKRDRSSSLVSQIAETVHTTMTIFISVIFYTVAFVLTTIGEIVVSTYTDPSAVCDMSSSPIFYMATSHILVVDFVLVINPFVYALRNRSMRRHIMKSPHIFRSLWAVVTGREVRIRQQGSSI